MGVVAIEKHFILNKNLNSPDRKFSIDPRCLKELKENVKLNEIILGSEVNKLKKSEKPSLF